MRLVDDLNCSDRCVDQHRNPFLQLNCTERNSLGGSSTFCLARMAKKKIGIGVRITWNVSIPGAIAIFIDLITVVEKEVDILSTQAIAGRGANLISHFKDDGWMAPFNGLVQALKDRKFGSFGVDLQKVRLSMLFRKVIQFDRCHLRFFTRRIRCPGVVTLAHYEIQTTLSDALFDEFQWTGLPIRRHLAARDVIPSGCIFGQDFVGCCGRLKSKDVPVRPYKR